MGQFFCFLPQILQFHTNIVPPSQIRMLISFMTLQKQDMLKLPEQILTGSVAPFVTAGLERSMLEMFDGANLRSHYSPDLGSGVDVDFEFGDKRNYEPDALTIKFASGSASRTLFVETTTTQHHEPALNLGSGDAADSFPIAMRVDEVADIRQVQLADDVVVTKSFVTHRRDGSVTHHKIRVPFSDSNPAPEVIPNIGFRFEGEELEYEATGIIYSQDEKGQWSMFYYASCGGKNYTSMYRNKHDISVDPDSADADKIGKILASAGDLGGPDSGLKSLVGTTVTKPDAE